jgi:signal peptidase I
MLYFGPSMNPTLRPGDDLVIAPCAGREVRVGDVVVFAHPHNPGERVVHRVAAVEEKGLRTRGDNCPAADPWLVEPDSIIGYVAAVRRGGRTLPVRHGVMGKIHVFQTFRRLDEMISAWLRPLYRRLAATTPLKGWLHPRLLVFERAGGRECQLWLGPWLIGRRLPHGDGWQIKRPFRLFVDETELP